MKQFFLVAAVAISVTGNAQKVSNKLTFQKGQKLEMVSKVASTISMEMMGQSMDTKIDATITRLFDVNDVSNGTASVEHKMKRMQMNMEAPMAGSQSFDSENEKDMKGEAVKAMETALKNKYSMTIDPTGKITAVKADDDNPNKAEKNESGDMMAGAMSGMVEGMSLPKAGDVSEFRILPEAGATKGGSWTGRDRRPRNLSKRHRCEEGRQDRGAGTEERRAAGVRYHGHSGRCAASGQCA